MEASEQISAGLEAVRRAEWARARTLLEGSTAAEALDGLGQALWFSGEIGDAVATRERAFEAYAREGRCDEAAHMAVWVSHQHMVAGRASAARGWLARAERTLDGACGGAGAGWVAVERSRHAADVPTQIAHARTALQAARETGAADLEVFALSQLGRAEISAGNRAAGMDLLEEAMAAAAAGQVANVHTLAEAYCNLIAACTNAGEWELAAEWCELVDEWARGHDTQPLVGACRTIHADVLVARGRWPEAEHALQTALETQERFIPSMNAPTVALLAELRVQQGRLRDAERLLADREEHPSSLRALALLRIAEGRPQVAAALLERGLAAIEGDALRATQLLAALVEASLACGDVARAESAGAELRDIADSAGIRLVTARAELAAAKLALAAGRPADAAEPARRALVAFGALAMPLDAGVARMALAAAIADRQPDAARDEVTAALAAFEELGAGRAADAAAGQLRELGGGHTRPDGDLTAREQEVLGLIARGMSNAQIAHALVISEKTAGHHVSRILMKLGVKNRAAAAAHATRVGMK